MNRLLKTKIAVPSITHIKVKYVTRLAQRTLKMKWNSIFVMFLQNP